MAENDMVELPGLHVNIDDVVYQPQFPAPTDHPHCFAYYITIHNESETTVTIKGRKWVVKESSGEVTAVEPEDECELLLSSGDFVLSVKLLKTMSEETPEENENFIKILRLLAVGYFGNGQLDEGAAVSRKVLKHDS